MSGFLEIIPPIMIGSKFRVQARPGATGCVSEIAFTFNGIGFSSPHLDKPGLGQGFKGFKMLNSVTLYSIVWIGLHHPLGETWDSAPLMRNTIDRDQLGHFNRER